MRFMTPLVAAATFLASALAFANGTSGKLTDSDKDFLNKAAQGNMAEVKTGELATTHAASDSVKAFGKKMVADHSKALKQIQSLADKKGVTLPAEPNADQQKTAVDLAKLSGADFDKAYMDDMVKDHDEDVAEFQKAAKDATDKDIRGLANKLLPTLKSHQKMAHSGDLKHM